MRFALVTLATCPLVHATTCGEVKEFYRENACCGNESSVLTDTSSSSYMSVCSGLMDKYKFDPNSANSRKVGGNGANYQTNSAIRGLRALGMTPVLERDPTVETPAIFDSPAWGDVNQDEDNVYLCAGNKLKVYSKETNALIFAGGEEYCRIGQVMLTDEHVIVPYGSTAMDLNNNFLHGTAVQLSDVQIMTSRPSLPCPTLRPNSVGSCEVRSLLLITPAAADPY